MPIKISALGGGSPPLRPVQDFVKKSASPPRVDWLNVGVELLAGGRVAGSRHRANPQGVYAALAPLLEAFPDSVKGGVDQLKGLLQAFERLEGCRSFESREQELLELAGEMTQKIEGLHQGTSQLLFIQGKAFACLIEVVRRDKQYFDLNLFPSPGIEGAFVGDKQRQAPMVRYEKIPERHLFCSEGHGKPAVLIQGLLEFHLLPMWGVREYQLDDVLVCFNYLKDFRVASAVEVTGVRGGTHVASATKAWIRNCLKERGDYKAMMLQLESDLFMAAYQGLEGKLRTSHEARRFLIEAGRNLLGKGLKLQHGSLRHVEQVLKAVEKVNQEVDTGQRTETWPIDCTNFVSTHEHSTACLKFQVDDEPVTPMISRATLLGTDDLKAICDKVYEGDFKEITSNLEIHKAIDALDFSLAEKLDLNQAEERVALLDRIAGKYRTTMQFDYPARRYTTLLSLQVMIHALIVKIEAEKGLPDAARISHYQLAPLHMLLQEADGLTYLHRGEFERLEEIKQYVATFNDARQKGPLFAKEGKDSVVDGKLTIAKGNTAFFAALVKHDSELAGLLEKKQVPDYRDLTDWEINKNFQDQEKSYMLKWTNRPPQRRVNLPVETKQVLFLQQMDPEKEHPLDQRGYRYINAFRRVQFMVTMAHCPEHAKLATVCTRSSWYTPCGEIEWAQEIKGGTSVKEHVMKFHTDVLDDAYHSFGGRVIDAAMRGSAEGNVLKSHASVGFVQKLERDLTEWKLAPSQLLYEATEALEVFKDPSMRTLFKLLMFRSPVEGRRERLGVGELLLEDAALQQNAREFILKGVHLYETKQGGAEVVRFFFDLAYHFAKYMVDAGKGSGAFDLLKEINEVLISSRCTKSERSTLHLSRVLAYSLKESYTEAELIEIYTSWTHCQLYPEARTHRPILSYLDAQHFLIRLTSQKAFDAARVTEGVFKGLSLSEEPLIWPEDPDIQFPVMQAGRWHINLLEGKVYVEGEVYEAVQSQPVWEQQSHFQRLFPTSGQYTFEYFSAGGSNVSFSHPEMGRVKLVKTESGEYNIRRTFTQFDGWYEYRSVDDKTMFPAVLKEQYAFWVPVEHSQPKGIFASIKTSRPEYIIETSSGKVALIEDRTVSVTFPGEYQTQLKGLKVFERADPNILLFYRENTIVRIEFPRCHLEGSEDPLSFKRDGEGRLIWKEQKGYFLSLETPRGALGREDSYLQVRPVDGKGVTKLLLPFTHEGNVKYFVLNEKDGQVEATTLEGHLYLAYIYLRQARYEEAIALIHRIKPTDTLSETSHLILSIIEGEPLDTSHPEGALTRLHALKMRMRSLDATALEAITDYFVDTKSDKKAICDVVLIYLQGLNNASIETRLSNSDELYILENLRVESGYEQITRRIAYLKSGKHQHEQKALSTPSFPSYLPSFSNYLPFGLGNFLDELPEAHVRKMSREDKHSNENHAMNAAKTAVTWLKHRKCSKFVTFAEDESFFHENGQLLFEVLQLAQENANFQSAKEAMVFRLLLWKRHAKGDTRHLDMMLAILAKPTAFPKPIQVDNGCTSIKEQAQFLKKILKGYGEREGLGRVRGMFKALEPFPEATIVDSVEESSYFDTEEVAFVGETHAIEIGPVTYRDRWRELEGWKTTYLSEVAGEKASLPKFACGLEELELSSDLAPFQKRLEQDLQELLDEYAEGAKQIEAVPIFTLNDPQKLAKAAEGKVQDLQKEERRKRAELFALANTGFSSSGLAGGLIKKLDFQECVDALLTGDLREYRARNSHLDDTEIREIAQRTLEICHLKSYTEQVRQIAMLAEKIGQLQPDDPLYNHYCSQLNMTLEARYHFDQFSVEQQVALSIFAGQSGLIPYQKQLALIEKLSAEGIKGSVVQLIMGGGKTSVLATILLYLFAKRERRLALFLVPDPLFQTVCSNLSDSMLKTFNKQVLSIDVVHRKLTNYKLRQIKATLKRAVQERLPLVMKGTTVQSLELKLLSESRRLAQADAGENLMERLHLLEEIVSMFKDQGDALIDEEDILLAHNSEVIYPSGERKPIDRLENGLLKIIFEAMTSRELRVETLPGKPSIDDLLCFRKNSGATIDEGAFKEHIIPLITEHICAHFEAIQSAVKEHRTAFQAYLNGTIVRESESERAFLDHLEKLYQSDSQWGRQAANLIAAAKFYLHLLAPNTLQKQGNRHFGPPDDGRHKAVMVPYKAALKPASTEFGNHRELAYYQYRYAAAFDTAPEQILEMADGMQKAAEHYQRRGEAYEETAEYQQFLKIFGVRLDLIREPGMIQKAQKFVAKNMDVKLGVELEVVGKHVSYNTEVLRSDAISLLSALSSSIAMSGTTSNAPGLTRALAEQHERDRGTEGKILHTLLKGAHEQSIHQKRFESIEEVLGSILDASSPEKAKKIRGIIETGGQFVRLGSNEDVAQQIAAVLKARQETGRVDAELEGVLFFNKKNELHVWKLGATTPELIGGSSFAALDQKGLKPKHYFVLYDEDHTTGTDILQLPDAINLITFDQKMLQRTLCQGAMRLRQLLSSQAVEFIITAEARQKLVQRGKSVKSVKSLILSAFKEQSISRTESMVSYFIKQIDNLFRSHVINALRRALANHVASEEYQKLVKEYEPFFVTTFDDEPYLLFGRLREHIETKKMLIDRLQKKMESFKMISDQQLVKEVQTEATDLETYIGGVDVLPETCESPSLETGVEQEIATQQEHQVEVQNEVEVEQQLQLELKSYRFEVDYPLRKEEALTAEDIEAMVEGVKQGAYTSLEDQLRAYQYRQCYDHCFSQPIYGTKAYFNTLADGAPTLPIFHQFQRPPKQILAVESDTSSISFLLLTEFEASCVQAHLKDNTMKGVWLIQPDGSLLVEGSQPFNCCHASVEPALFEINILAGHPSYLMTHIELLQKWLADEPEIKKQFMKLRIGDHQSALEVFHSCISLVEQQEIGEALPSLHLYQERFEREQQRRGTLVVKAEQAPLLTGDEIKQLHIDSIKYLNHNQLCHLQPFHIPYVTDEQIPHLPVEQVRHLLTPTQHLTEAQLSGLVPAQRHFIKSLPDSLLPKLTAHWQVQAIPLQRLIHTAKDQRSMFSRAQVKCLEDIEGLTEHQYGWVDANKILQMPPQYVREAHVQGITDPSLISQLKNDWVHWISPGMVSAINPEKQLQFLKTQDQIQAVDNQHVAKLSVEQVAHVQASQVPYLEGAAQIAACPEALEQHLTEQQLDQEIEQHSSDKRDKIPHSLAPKPYEPAVCQPPQLLTTGQQVIVRRNQLVNMSPKGLAEHHPLQIDLTDITSIKLVVVEQQIKSATILFSNQAIHVSQEGLAECIRIFANMVNFQADGQRHILPRERVKCLEGIRHLQGQMQAITHRAHLPHSFALTVKIDLAPLGIKKQTSFVVKMHVLQPSTSQVLCLKGANAPMIQNQKKIEMPVELVSRQSGLTGAFGTKTKLPRLPGNRLQQMRDAHQLLSSGSSPMHAQQQTEMPVELTSQQSGLTGAFGTKVQGHTQTKLPRLPVNRLQQMRDAHQLLSSGSSPMHAQQQTEMPVELTSQQSGLTGAFGTKVQGHTQTKLPRLPVNRLQQMRDAHQLLPSGLSPALALPVRVRHLSMPSTQQHKVEEVLPKLEPVIEQQPSEEIGAVPSEGDYDRYTEAQWKAFPTCQIRDLDNKYLQYLKTDEQIQSVSFGKVEYLTSEQLRKRTWGQFLAYAIGVVILGLVGSVIAVVAYLTIIPIEYMLGGRCIKAAIDQHPRRLYHLIVGK